jgi:hypothetical protein
VQQRAALVVVVVEEEKAPARLLADLQHVEH